MKKRWLDHTVFLVLLLSPLITHAANIRFPGVMTVPENPKLSFGGYFKNHQPVKIVFSASDPGKPFQESLNNAALVIRYLKARGYRYDIQFVLYGKATFAADSFSQRYSNYGPLMRALHKAGVQFRVCHNSMYALHIKQDDLYSYMKVIPAGILQLVKKQMQGYAYIRN